MKYNLDWLLNATATKQKLKYLYFWGHRPAPNNEITASCFSQWWDGHPFESEGIIYLTAEHYMMAAKAQLFGDYKIYEAILTAETPGKAKALGRQVKNFDFNVWVSNRCEIVTKGNYLKFSQHEELKRFLLNTNNRVLVEASPVDRVWGIGLVKDDPNASAPALWQGENLLGFCLMEARDLLI
ncbi:MAG: NADAR domain-containing protein [Saprospiraceae bacterium]